MKKNKALFYGTIFSLVLTLVAIVLRLLTFRKEAPPIVPTNPGASYSEPMEVYTVESTDKTEETTTSSEDFQKKSVILSAIKNELSEYEDEEIITYTIEKEIEPENLRTEVVRLAVAKMSEENMKAQGYEGEGLITIEIDIDNLAEQPYSIQPLKTVLTVNDKKYPILADTNLQDGPIEPKESINGEFSASLPLLEKVTDIEEVSFEWIIQEGEKERIYEVVILLNEE